MIKSRLLYVSVILLLIGGGLWLELRQREVLEYSSQRGTPNVALGEDNQGASGSAIVAKTESSLAAIESLEGVEDNWSERYPEARVIESRLVETAVGFVRLQRLLATGSERIPWVVWEYKLEQNEAGVYESVGSVAHMGNVILVEADPNVIAPADLEAFMADHDLFEERRSAVADYLCLGFENPSLGKIEELLNSFKASFPGVIAEFDTLSFPSVTPNDWDTARMWGLDRISARDAWRFEKGDTVNDVVIAIIDTGTQRLHPDLVGNLFANPGDGSANRRDDDGNGLVDDTSGWDFIDNDADPQDDDGHGTHVAGIAGAVGNNGTGAVGVNWGVRLLPLKVGDGDGLRTSAINDALAYVSSLRRAGVNIVATNNSYGSGGSNPSTRSEIAIHEQLGILFVAASGNDGKNIDASAQALEFPAGYTLDNIISVGSSNQEDTLNDSSNFGTTSVDLSAPGSDIYSTYPTNSYDFLSGTSMASPMVAGAVGLLAQAEPELSAPQLKARLLETADRVPSQSGFTLSGGRLNMLAALRPELSGHFVEVTNVKDAMVLLESVGDEVVFKTSTHTNATVTVTEFYGVDVGRIENLGSGTFKFVAETAGQSKIRFSASLGGVVRSVQKTVIVGDSVSVDDGLLHRYAFDGSGGTESDLAGTSQATISGAARSDSAYGSSLAFDSTSDQVSFDGTFSDVVTIAALVRLDDMSVSPHPRIVNMPYYYLYFSSGDGLEFPDGNRQTLKFFSNYTNFGVWNAPPRSIKDRQWYYVVGSYNSTNILNTPSLYLNAEQQVVRMQQEPTGTMVQTGGLSYLGNNEALERAFDGLMADVRIYNRVLSPVEVSQLGASLTQDSWDSVEIAIPSTVVRDLATSIVVEDSSGFAKTFSADWFFEGESSVDVLSASGASASVRFDAVGTYFVTAQVSDGVTTRVIKKEVEVLDGRVTEGHYLGSATGGGLAWLEIDDSLTAGVITMFDPVSGFYRIREPITISEQGVFETSEISSGKIRGVALSAFSAEVESLDLLFSGELQAKPSSSSEYEGMFHGGGISLPGDSIEMRVLDDGRVFLWREGPFADLAFGTHDIGGRVVLTAASSESVDLTIDTEANSVTGSWGGNSIFLTADGIASDARMLAGVVGGFPSGSGGLGLFSEFLEEGESASEALVTGGLAELSLGQGTSENLLTLDVLGRSQVMAAGEEAADVISGAVESGAIDLAAQAVEGVRLQTPISSSGYGLVAFSIEGTEPLEVLVRGLGPSFSNSSLSDPMVTIYRLEGGDSIQLAPNDDWRDGTLFSGENEIPQGAFRALESGFSDLELSQLTDDAKDAAQRVWLEPGSYMVLVELVDGESGSGLIEVFAL